MRSAQRPSRAASKSPTASIVDLPQAESPLQAILSSYRTQALALVPELKLGALARYVDLYAVFDPGVYAITTSLDRRSLANLNLHQSRDALLGGRVRAEEGEHAAPAARERRHDEEMRCGRAGL